MNNKIIKFEFNNQSIDFEPTKSNVMVNATQMANAFGKRVDVFLKTEHAKQYISVLEFTPFGGNSSPLKREEIIQTKGQNGTWMHRILALKFAAWLDPKFELWIYSTIEQLLFGDFNNRNATLTRKAEIRAEKEKLLNQLQENEHYKKLQELQAEEMRIGKEMHIQDNEIVKRQYTLMFDTNN